MPHAPWPLCLLGILLATAPAADPVATPAARPSGQELVQRELKLVARFDRDGDGRLDEAERAAARRYLDAEPGLRPPRRPRDLAPGWPGAPLAPADVPAVPAAVPLYDEDTLRTVFLDFDRPDWEAELAAFHTTDVDVPALLTVDGVRHAGTGVHFRGHNSFLTVPDGRKRSLALSPDFTDPRQRLLGHRGLHLMNAYQDPTFVKGALFLRIAREYIRAPRANFVRVVINGESWGIYVNQQRFDADFVRDHFGRAGGARWRSLNASRAGGLSYLGEDPAAYRESYEIKSADDPAAWQALVTLCRVLDRTPPGRLAEALDPILDVDAALRFLALDNALMNGDGYWAGGDDFSLYLAPDGRFYLIPYDVNEAFRSMGVPGTAGAARTVELDPLHATTDARKALAVKLLAAPELRARYLGYVRDIAERWLDWTRIGPVVARYQALIADDVARDGRKLYPTLEFTTGVHGDGQGEPPITSLRGFVTARRAYLLRANGAMGQ